MKTIITKLSIIAVILSCGIQAYSTILITDNFNYTINQPLATNGGWTSFILQTTSEKSSAIDEVTVVDQTLSYSGYLSSNTGKSILLDGLNKDAYCLFPYIDGVTSNKTTGGLDIASGGRIASGDVYAAMLINVERAFYGAGDPEDTKGDCFFAFGANTWGIGAAGRIYTRKLGNGYQIGVTRAGNAKTVWDPTERSLNMTYLVVLKYSIIESPNGEKNDRVYLSINPTLSTTEPTWIANDATDANAELPNIVGAVQFLQKINTSATNPATVYSKIRVGGLRVATTWAEVGDIDPSNGINKNESDNINIKTVNGEINISDINGVVSLFDALGHHISTKSAINGVCTFKPAQRGVYILKTENKSLKVVI